MHKHRRLVVIVTTPLVIAPLAITSWNVMAAEPAATGENTKLEAVVVTAERREQDIQSVKTAISAISGKQLEQRNATGIEDIARLVPSVSYVPEGPGHGQLTMRGIALAASNATELRFKTSVGVYFDETPVGFALYNPNLNTFDLNRVEVLRGPQGTLYGAGSLSGTIKFVTNPPDASGYRSAIRGIFSSTEEADEGNYSIDAMFNAPLIPDKAAVRAVLGYRVDDAYIDNLATGDDAGRYTTKSARVALGFEPTERLNLTLKANVQQYESNGISTIDLVEENAASVGVIVGPFEQWRFTPEPLTDDFMLLALEANYEMDWADLTFVSSYLDRDIHNDHDFTYILMHDVGLDAMLSPLQNPLSYDGYVHELRLTSSGVGRWTWLGGLLYSDAHKRFGQSLPTPGSDAIFGPAEDFGAEPDNLFQSRIRYHETQKAVFGEVAYKLTDRLEATVGGRWFDYEEPYDVSAVGVFNGGPTQGEASSSASDFNPKYVLSYQATDRILLAAQAARGFRLGGANDVVPTNACAADLAALGLTSAPLSFGSESLWSYELNAKSSWLDDRLIVNAGVFDMHYDDVQVSQSLLGCGFGFTFNGGKASSKGVELEFAGRIGSSFDWSAGIAYVDAQLEEDLQFLGVKGDRLILSPDWMGNAFGRYSFPLAELITGFVQLDYQYRGGEIQTFGYYTNPALDQPTEGYDLTSLRIGIETRSLEASLFVNNLFDDSTVVEEEGELARGRISVQINRPRTIGVSLSWRL